MKRLQFLLAVYIVFAIAALRRPSHTWTVAWFTATVAVLVFAAIRAVYSRGSRRYFWAGFAITGGVFLAVNILPLHPMIITRPPFEMFYDWLSYDPRPTEKHVWVAWGRGYQKWRLNPPLPGQRKGRYRVTMPDAVRPGFGELELPPSELRPVSPHEYVLLCLPIFAIPLGIVGGIVGRSIPNEPQGVVAVHKRN
jgi:hypothetical protein